jgi:type VI secretion system secreted protein VgrG
MVFAMINASRDRLRGDSKMKRRLVFGITTMAALAFCGLHNQAQAQFLGTASSFAALAGSTVTNTGSTVLSGDLGVWPGTAITGFPPGIVTNGATHAGDVVAQQAQSDVTTAYDVLAGEAVTQDLTGQDLGGMTLLPGVYHFSSSAFLTGPLTLNDLGDPNARFDFQIGSTLITAPNSSVNFIGSSKGCNVYWQVGSSATLDTNTTFAGHILALTSITMNTGATIGRGSVLARNGAVTLQSNTLTACGSETPPSAVPEPSSILLFCTGLATLAAQRRRK